MRDDLIILKGDIQGKNDKMMNELKRIIKNNMAFPENDKKKINK